MSFNTEEVETPEEKTEELQVFTLEDAAEDEEACLICSHRPTCAIIAYVNKLSIKRDGKTAEDSFSCSIFKSEEEQKKG